MEWLRSAPTHTFDPTSVPADWSVTRPFFHVPRGGRNAYRDVARGAGVELRRSIEVLTGGNPVFITSGIPGSVGSGAVALWTEMLEAERAGMPFNVWPFDGVTLADAPAAGVPTIAETYPRALYAVALDDRPASERQRLRVAKTDAGVRTGAVLDLQKRPWIRDLGVRLDALNLAAASEDHFDAMVAAAGLLRAILAGEGLWHPDHVCPTAEGGMVGTGAIDLALKERTFVPLR